MFNLYHICLLRAFEHIQMEFARYKCLLLLLLKKSWIRPDISINFTYISSSK